MIPSSRLIDNFTIEAGSEFSALAALEITYDRRRE
jgi:hypothetical protein